ncbi:CHAT domain-containing protein [Cellulomonas sp. P5_C5]
MSRAAVLLELGSASASARDLDAAARAVGRATDMDLPDQRRLLAQIGMSRAVADQAAGRRAAAESRLWGVLDVPGVDGRLAVVARNNLALVLAERGAYAAAIEQADEALRRSAELPALQALLIQTRAWVAVRAGHLIDGLREFHRSAEAYEAAGMPLGEYYTEYADAMVDLRLLPEASSAAERAVEEFVLAGVPLLATEARLRLARISLLAGELERAGALADEVADEARQQRRGVSRDHAVLIGVESRLGRSQAGPHELVVARRAAGRFERAGNLHSAVEAYLVAGRVALSIDRDRDAVQTLSQADGLARSGQVLVRLRGRVAAALAARVEERPSAALVHCRTGLRDLAHHRSSLPTIELRALASGHGAELGEIGLGVYLDRGQPARTLAWMERTRAAALLMPVPAPSVPLTREHPQAVEVADAVPVEVRDGSATRAARDDEHEARAAGWRQTIDPPARSPRPADVVSLADLRVSLGERTLVEFGSFEGRFVAVVVEPRLSRLVELGPTAAVLDELRPLLFALRRLANVRSAAAAGAARASADLRIARLRALLMAPLGIAGDAEIVVVPVGMLHGVPWSCLHDGPLAQAPSATFWARTLRAADEHADGGRTVLVAGPELDGALEEVEALRAVHAGALVLTHERSHAEAVVSALADADLAHLACHGSPRADNSMFSSLLLADGPVTVQELHGAGVAPHRLILASCHSGADVAYLGDEVLGFVSAMLAQGTAGVVASIAAVPDVAAVDLMLELHRGLRDGMTLARALHAARGQVDRDTPEGFVNWCTFSAHGAA